MDELSTTGIANNIAIVNMASGAHKVATVKDIDPSSAGNVVIASYTGTGYSVTILDYGTASRFAPANDANLEFLKTKDPLINGYYSTGVVQDYEPPIDNRP